jgi:hypothetical protein
LKFLLRVDDIGWTSEESDRPPCKKQDVGLEIAKRFHDALDGIPYLAGVIPAYVDVNGIEWIESEPKGMTVALHGFGHGEPTPGDRHEFEGKSEDFVRTRIAEGRRIVGPTQYYIPPFNSLNPAHVGALWHEGIRYVFGRELDWPTPPSPYELDHGVKFIPSWSRLYGAIGWQQGAAKRRLLDEIQDIHEFGREAGVAVMTLHLPWESARDPEFKHTKSLKKFRDMFITPDQFVAEIK